MAAVTAKYYFRFCISWCHCLQKVKVYKQTKFRWDISVGGWDITNSGFEIQTSAILAFYFRFWSGPVHRNLHLIVQQATEFRPNRSTHCEYMTSYPFLNIAAATAKYYFWLRVFSCHCLQKVKIYQQTKFCRDTSIGGWDITTFGFEIQTSAILEFYFRFRYRPVCRNLHVFLHQTTEFRPNPTAEICRHIHFSRWRPRPLNTTSGFVFVNVAAFRRSKSISKPNFVRYLNRRLRSNYFRFRNTNLYFRLRYRPFCRNRRVILHPAADFRPIWNIRHWNMTSYRFSRWRPSAMLCLLWGNGGPPAKCLPSSEFRPQIAS